MLDATDSDALADALASTSASAAVADSARHVRVIYGPGMIEVRPATMSDARRLWRWANDPDTRRWSFSTDPIPWDGHLGWLRRVIDDPDRVLLVGYDEYGEVGTVRFDVEDGRAEVSITVAPECRGSDMARPLLDAAMLLAPCATVEARVFADNVASARLFSGWQHNVASPEGTLTFTRARPASKP